MLWTIFVVLLLLWLLGSALAAVLIRVIQGRRPAI